MKLESSGVQLFHCTTRRAIGFWMMVPGADPVHPVAVFVSYLALAQADSAQPHDAHAAEEVFKKRRTEIEAAASEKYRTHGTSDYRYQHQDTVVIAESDWPANNAP